MKNLYFIKKNNIRLVTKLALFVLVLFGRSLNSLAEGNSVAEINKRLSKSMFAYQNKQVLVGGDFSLDFVASAPYTYSHSTGGGAFDDRTIGKTNDVVESLEGGDFKCGDVVSYLTKITVRSGAGTGANAQTIKLSYSFLAAATGQPGVALGEFVGARINRGQIIYNNNNIGDNNGYDAGMVERTAMDAVPSQVRSLTSSNFEDILVAQNNNHNFAVVGANLFTKPARLEGDLYINGLEGGESIILRIDVRIKCDSRKPTGNLAGQLASGSVVVPMNLPKNLQSISGGAQTVPFKNIDQIQQGTCVLDKDIVKVCEGAITEYNLTTNGIPTWSLSGAIFVDANGDPIANNDPGTAIKVYVKATAPSGLKGSYTLHVDVNSIVLSISCDDVVDVYKNAEQPKIVIHEATLCGSITKPWIEVCSAVDGLKYELEYGDNFATKVSITNTATDNQLNYPCVKFMDLVAGKGFRIRAINQGECPSAWTDCNSNSEVPANDYILDACTNTCTPGVTRQAAPKQPQSAINKTNDKEMTAYPIPFSDKVTIEFKSKKAENYVINLYDMQGHLVKQLAAGNAKAGEVTRFDVDGKLMIDGMYLVRKECKSGVETVKLLKKE